MMTLQLELPDYGNLLPSRPWEMVNGRYDLDILVKNLILAWQAAALCIDKCNCKKRHEPIFQSQCRLWVEIEAHKWRDLELNLSKTVEELSQDSQLIQANSKKKLRDNKKLLECSFAQI